MTNSPIKVMLDAGDVDSIAIRKAALPELAQQLQTRGFALLRAEPATIRLVLEEYCKAHGFGIVKVAENRWVTQQELDGLYAAIATEVRRETMTREEFESMTASVVLKYLARAAVDRIFTGDEKAVGVLDDKIPF